MNSPKHVAIIMDGNGRWGIENKKSRNLGHKAGLKTLEKIIHSTITNKINTYFGALEVIEKILLGSKNLNI